MKNRTWIVVIILSIVSVLAFTIASTYAVIIEVTEKNGVTEIVNSINIRDLLTNDNGEYNNTYYNVVRELNITNSEAILLMEAVPLNEALQKVLNSIVEYKLHNKVSAKYTNEELFLLIKDATNNTETISDDLKNKVINKSELYIYDVSDFLYDLEVSKIGG
ncbi:MAG: hypothetical protein Q4C38_00495 [bacterium]|nr:hypothetical protein [bacterium]